MYRIKLIRSIIEYIVHSVSAWVILHNFGHKKHMSKNIVVFSIKLTLNHFILLGS